MLHGGCTLREHGDRARRGAMVAIARCLARRREFVIRSVCNSASCGMQHVFSIPCVVRRVGARGSDARMMSFWVLNVVPCRALGAGVVMWRTKLCMRNQAVHVARWRDCLRELLRLVDSCRFVNPVHTWRGRTRCACTHQGRVRCGAIAKNLPPHGCAGGVRALCGANGARLF